MIAYAWFAYVYCYKGRGDELATADQQPAVSEPRCHRQKGCHVQGLRGQDPAAMEIRGSTTAFYWMVTITWQPPDSSAPSLAGKGRRPSLSDL